MTSPRKMRTPKKCSATPSKLVQSCTPKAPRSCKSVQSPFVKAKNVLSSSANESLIGREEEYDRIVGLVKGALESRKTVTLYVSGPAGTGKTLTVNTVLQDLELKHTFKMISINCMSFETLDNFYQQVSTHYSSSPKKQRRNANSEQYYDLNKIKDSISQHNEMTVMLLDEVDQLKSKNNEVLRNIFQLPALTKNKLILIGISNALDFTVKMVWLKEVEKSEFHELRFMPYSKDQIAKIIDFRLRKNNGAENTLIDKSAVEYCARKIASCSGDIRKALDVCRRAVELVESKSRKGIVRALDFGSPLKPSRLQQQENVLHEEATTSGQLNHVDLKMMMLSLNKVYGGIVDKLDSESKVHLPTDQQLILCTLLLFSKFKAMREVRLSDCRQYLDKICAKKMITTEGKSEADILTMCQLLADCGYLEIKNDSPSLSAGRSPLKLSRTTPSKKKSVILSLRIDPSETEQLLSSFHKTIIADGAALMA